MEWPKQKPERSIDTDSPDDMRWLFEVAAARAEKFKIEGVTYARPSGTQRGDARFG